MTSISVQVELTQDQQDRLAFNVGASQVTFGGPIDACEIVFGNPEAHEIENADALRWIQLESVGFGEYLNLDWARLGHRITMINLAGFFADPVAETALAGILALTRGMDELIVLKGEKKWVGDPIRTQLRLLKGARVTMLGRGAINRRLTELLLPFGCKVKLLGSDTTPDAIDRELLATDILVAAVPDTPSTRGLLNARRLELMRPQAIFVNLGRGSLVDETALVNALQTGCLAGAVLDVTQNEPLEQDDPLWSCPNVLLTQHSGGGSHDEIDRKIDHFLANLKRYQAGEPLEGIVDIKRGY